MRARIAIGLVAGAALWSAAPAASAGAGVPARSGQAPVAPDLGKLLSCRDLPDAAARLACFDREAAALRARLDDGQLVVVDGAQVRDARRQHFGLAPPGLDLFAGQDGKPLSSLQSTVAGAVADRYGKWIVTLADGSRWHQIDDYELVRPPANGAPATVSRAAVGSFRMTIARQAMRVRRDR